MSYKIDFVNNEKYGADDINAVRSAIMTAGVLKKGDTDCLVTYMADGIHIAPGEALFGDGCRIEISEEIILPCDTADGYVYFDRNYYTTPQAAFGEELPENCIPLAQLNGGVVTDMRDFATLKMPSMAPNRYLSKELELNFDINHPSKVTKSITFEDRTDINYLTFIHQFGKYKTRFIIDFTANMSYGWCYDGRINSTAGYINLSDLGLYLDINKTGNTVYFDINSETVLDLGYATVTAL